MGDAHVQTSVGDNRRGATPPLSVMAKKKHKVSKIIKASGKKPTVTELRAKQMAVIEKKFGKGSAMTVGAQRRAAQQIKEFIPSGVDVLDNYVIGRGGLPVGRISEVFGPYACGKTSLLYKSLAQCQRIGGIAALADPENSFDEERAAMSGIDLNALVMLEAFSLEDTLLQMRMFIEAHDERVCPLLMGWDSIASAVSQSDIDRVPGDKKVASEAGVIAIELKKLNRLLPRKRTHLMMLNQVRDKIGVMFGDKTSTPGGNAPKFYSSLRIQFFGGKGIKNKHSEHTGKVVTIMAVKNRLAPPFRKARVRFDYATGYNNVWSTLEHAKRMKLIKPRTEGYSGPGVASLDNYWEAMEILEWEPSSLVEEDFDEDDLDYEYDDDEDDD